jgi:hypothetical protein
VCEVAKEFNTDWFDLSKYNDVDKLGLHEWHQQLRMRCYMRWRIEDNVEIHKGWIDQIKAAPIIRNSKWDYSQWKEGRGNNPDYYSVYSTPAQFHWLEATDDRFADVWEACQLDEDGKATEEQRRLIQTPYTLLSSQRGMSSEEVTGVTVNLTATDEQIISDFKKWLPAYRKASGYTAHDKNFTDKNLADWSKWRVLPYIDLWLVAKASGAIITQNKMARLIFSDEDSVDIVDRLRRTTRPKAEWLMGGKILEAISAQIAGSA